MYDHRTNFVVRLVTKVKCSKMFRFVIARLDRLVEPYIQNGPNVLSDNHLLNQSIDMIVSFYSKILQQTFFLMVRFD